MRYGKILPCLAAALALAACSDDSGITDQGPPDAAALVRFINVNVDTGTVDLRFIDRIENLPTLIGVPFRGASGMYQRAFPGARPTRVFPSPTDPERDAGKSLTLASTILVDKPVSLAADARYTLVFAGRVSGNAAQLVELTDPAPATPPAGQIAVKALHTAFGTGAVDVYIVPVASATAATPADFQTVNAGVIRNVGYLTQSGYVNVPIAAATGLYRFVVTAAGSGDVVFASTPNQPGTPTPAGQLYGPQPGVRIAGSALTAVVAPGAIAGTRLAVAANTTPSVFLVPDKVLNL